MQLKLNNFFPLVVLCSSVASAVLYFVLFPTVAFGAVGNTYQVGTSTFQFVIPGGSVSNLQSPQGSPVGIRRVYKGVWPSVSTQVSSFTNGNSATIILDAVVPTTATRGCVRSLGTDNTTYFTCNMEFFASGGSTNYGDGDYWLQFNATGIGVNWEWYGMKRTNGVWTLTAVYQPTVPSPTYLTRFLSGTVSGNRNASVINYSYFLNTSEFTVGNRPDYVSVQTVNNATGEIMHEQNQFLLPLTQGTSSRSTTPDDLKSDGTYTTYLNFWNIQNNKTTFDRTSLAITYTYTGNVISNVNAVIQNGTQLQNLTTYEQCDFADLFCSARNTAKYLFIPTQSSIDNMKFAFSSSSIPWVQAGYRAFNFSKTYLASGYSPEAFTYHYDMQFTSAGQSFDIRLFSLSDVTTYLAPYSGVTRPVALTLIILLFIYMVFNSINNIVELTISPDNNRLKR